MKDPVKEKHHNNPFSNKQPSYIHNIDYEKFGHSKVGGIMQQKYKQT